MSRVSPSLKHSLFATVNTKCCSLIRETVTVLPSDDTSHLLKVYKRISQSHFQYFHKAVGHSNKIIVSQKWRNHGNRALKIAPVRQPVHTADAVKKS